MKFSDIENSIEFNQRRDEIKKLIKPFYELVIFHEKFRVAFDQVLKMLVSLPPGSLLYLVGPTGVGKTALIRTLMNRFQPDPNGSSSSESSGEQEIFSPPIYVEAPSPQKHSFNWTDFDIRMLREFKEPCIWFKTDLERDLQKLREGNVRYLNAPRGPSDWILFQCIENSLRTWKPPFVCIDEIHNILKMKLSAASFEDQMDILKSLANLPKVTFLLSGTYKTRDLIYEGDETTRRSRVVHFGRYLNSGQDFDDFQDFLNALREYSPLPLDFEPLQHLRYFYSNCVGCLGILKDWFYAANCIALLDDRDRVTLSDFEFISLEKKQLVELIQEINSFERYFSECPDVEIIDTFWNAGYVTCDDASQSVVTDTTPHKKIRRNKQKPGEMKPTRLPLSEDIHDGDA